MGILHIPTGKQNSKLKNWVLFLGYLIFKRSGIWGFDNFKSDLWALFNIFPSIVYICFCTSKHLTVGTFAIISIMVYSTISRLEPKYMEIEMSKLNSSTMFSDNLNLNGTELVLEKAQEVKLKIANSLAFWCGIVQVILSIFKFGSITKYLSQPLLKGFTTGASFHVFTTQMQHIFGIYGTKPNRSPYFRILKVILEILLF